MEPLRSSQVLSIIKTLWAILILYWLLSAFGNKKAKTHPPWARRLAFIIIFLITWSALVSDRHHLAIPLLPTTLVTQLAGIVLCAAGLAFAIWARRILGRNWSGFVVIKQDHELIRTGPYTIVRHPIYTGLILAIAGTVLAFHVTIAGLCIVLFWLVAFYIKSRREESILTQEFGDKYTAYKKQVRAALIPFIL
ncbi:MAG: isoprenylcysteine carboxylmethyltransferase family protein [Chthoniobacteraceae bacterium]|jgi:protein-S-isoprenylcysteine O-methyltransferase Ste14